MIQLVILLLLSTLSGSLGQIDGLRPIYANAQWRVANAAPVEKFWAVLEVEFHLVATCDQKYREAPISSGFISFSSSGSHPPSRVFDGEAIDDIGTAWWPQCTEQTGGCGVGEAWVGQDFTAIWPDLKCLRIFQPSDPSYASSAVSFEKWNGTGWEQVKLFEDLGRGVFDDLPVEPLTIWRILPLVDIQTGWAVAELSFFRDIECTHTGLQPGNPGAYGHIGNGSAASDIANPPAHVYDGKEATHWVAPCPNGRCSALEPFLDINLHRPGNILCVKILQLQDQGVQSVILQSWTGDAYINVTSFSALTPGTWDHLYRWEDCTYPANSLWRVLPNETVPGHWTVFELELHRNINCSELMPTGTIIAAGALNDTSLASAFFEGNSSMSYPAAFDFNTSSFYRAPKSQEASGTNWPGWYGGNVTMHVLGFPWLGISVPQELQGPRCLKFLQSNALADATASLVVQTWNGSAWEDYSAHIPEAGTVSLWYTGLTDMFTQRVEPTWIKLPALDRTQWRLKSSEVLWEHWAVKELYFYEAVDCTVEVTGMPMATGQDPAPTERPASNAFDRQEATEWWSTCNECIPDESFIGLALHEPRNLRCVSMLQSSQAPRNRPVPWWTVTASIEKWNGHRWIHIEDASGLGQGVWDRMYVYTHTPFWDDAVSGIPYWMTDVDSLWRIVNADPVPQRWTIPSLTFYSDFDCNVPMDDAVPISSGFVSGADMAGAFGDDSLDSAWISSCERCSARQAWLGLSMPTPRWVRCVKVFQSPTIPIGSRNIDVERWDGNAWNWSASLTDVVLGTWGLARLPNRLYPSEGDKRTRWRLANAEQTDKTWRIGSLQFFYQPNCTQPAEGILISSGWADGFEPTSAFDRDIQKHWESSCTGCQVTHAWLGVSLKPGVPALRCAQIWQQLETERGVTEVFMQVWSGDSASWINTADYTGLNYGAWNHLHMFTVPSLYMFPTPLPVSQGTMWRIVNTEAVIRSWVVVSLRLYSTKELGNCSGPILGVPIASGEATGFPASQALMDLSSTTTTTTLTTIDSSSLAPIVETLKVEWRAPCVGCPIGSAWIGLTVPRSALVECMEFEQSSDARDSITSMALERWDGVAWRTVSEYKGLSAGVKMRLSAEWSTPLPLQRFQILNLSPIQGSWQIQELKFFTDIECSNEVKGIPFSSGSAGDNVPGFAFDDDLSTAWGSSIVPAPPYNASLGLHFSSPHDVKCVAVRQSDAQGQWAQGILVERTGESGWEFVQELQPFSVGAWFVISTFMSSWDDVNINFQDEATELPPTYVGDFGKMYDSRPIGLKYGWSCTLRGERRQRFSNVIADTLVEITCDAPSVWEMDIIRGRYYVMITYSNPDKGGKTSGCYLEGQSCAAGNIPELEPISRKVRVDVQDGRLTFEGTNSTGCNSIAALQVRALPEAYAMWRITNGAKIVGRWRVNELELHGTTRCTMNTFQLRQREILASGWQQGAPPNMAVDGNIASAWGSPCAGCSPGEAWLGAAFSSFQMIRCIRVYQAQDGNSQSSSVVLENWNKTGWDTFQIYSETPGGIWGVYNDRWVKPDAGYRWRLVNVNPLNASLYLVEAAFFSDIGCQEKLPGFPIADHLVPSSPAANAYDSNFNSEWSSECTYCNPGEAWIGIHFLRAQNVMCAFAALSGIRTDVGEVQLRLEEWNETHWAGFGPIMSARPDAWAAAHRITAIPGLKVGALWRLVNILPTSAPWRVLELEFHATAECDDKVVGTPLSSSESDGFGVGLAFDGSTDYLSTWISGCSVSGCAAGSEWIGMLFPTSYLFQCIRIYHPAPNMAGDPGASSLGMERWTGSEWELVRSFANVQGGAWANLPVLDGNEKFSTPSKQWRVVADYSIHKNWAIREVRFFENIECDKSLAGTPKVSGESGSNFMTGAIDGRTDTSWWSQASPARGEAWLALVFGESHVVRCVQLLQNSDRDFSTQGVQLQALFGQDWLHIMSFGNVAAGQRQSMHVFPAVTTKPERSMWRVLNYDAVSEGWILTELEFYADAACNRIEIGTHMASGHTIGEEVAFGFDVQLDTNWRSSCRSCSKYEAWLGQSFFRFDSVDITNKPARLVNIKCVVVMQGDGPSNSSSTIIVERWSGSDWIRAGKFKDVPGNEFVQLRLDVVGNGSVVVDYERKIAMLQFQPPPADLTKLRQLLSLYNDLVSVPIRMKVSDWPLQLTSSLADSNAFTESVASAVRVTIGDRVDQPLTHVYIDSAQLNLRNIQTLDPASVSAQIMVYIARDPAGIATASMLNGGGNAVTGGSQQSGSSSTQEVPTTVSTSTTPAANASEGEGGRRLYVTDSQRVFEWFDGVASDPRGVEALFMVEFLKIELRTETRLAPLQASVITQIESSIEVQLGEPKLIYASQTTSPPPPPTPAPEVIVEEDNTVIYILMLAGIIIGAYVTKRVVDWSWAKKKLREDKQLWAITHPGEPFPRRVATGCICCRRYHLEEQTRSASDHALSIGDANFRDEFHQIGRLSRGESEQSRPKRQRTVTLPGKSISVAAAMVLGLDPDKAPDPIDPETTKRGSVASVASTISRMTFQSDDNQVADDNQEDHHDPANDGDETANGAEPIKNPRKGSKESTQSKGVNKKGRKSVDAD